MIKTPLSTVIGGAFWTPGATIVGSASKTFNQIIKSLFANNEQGFAYDPNDLTTLYQDAAGTIPVTAVGQPVGLALDKSKGLLLGPELYTGGEIQSAPIGGADFIGYSLNVPRKVGVMYVISFSVKNYQGTGNVAISGGTGIHHVYPIGISGNTSTTQMLIARTSASLELYTRSTNSCTFYNISVRELTGNHAYQSTSSMRPLLQDSPRRIDYDAVDDKLITNLPAQLTGCTVVRAVPSVGTQILTNQTIPTPYNDSTDHCGLIVINRALTTTETAQITRLFNKAAGV